MAELTQDLAKALNYFKGQSISLYPPISEAMIREAEQKLGLNFPPSMRKFLQVHNGIGLIDHRVLSVPSVDSENGIVEETLSHRQLWQEGIFSG